jgi:hypothetical protein
VCLSLVFSVTTSSPCLGERITVPHLIITSKVEQP